MLMETTKVNKKREVVFLRNNCFRMILWDQVKLDLIILAHNRDLAKVTWPVFESAVNGSVWAISAIRLDTRSSWREECCPRLGSTYIRRHQREIRLNEDRFQIIRRLLLVIYQSYVNLALKIAILWWFKIINFPQQNSFDRAVYGEEYRI